MTIRPLLLAILSFAAAIPCSAQTAPSDAQTLQSILTELRAIREEVKTTQTTQILLTELEMQQSVVNRATQQVGDIETKLTEVKAGQKFTADELARAKDQLDQTTDPQESKSLSHRIDDLKSNAAGLDAAVRERSASLQTAQQKLQDAQNALDDVEAQLNAIVRRMSQPRN